MSLTRIERSPLHHACLYFRDDLLALLGSHAELDYDIEYIEDRMLSIMGGDVWYGHGSIWPGVDGKYCSVRYFYGVLRRASWYWQSLPDRVEVFRVRLSQLGDFPRTHFLLDGTYGDCEAEDPLDWDVVAVGDYLVMAHFPSYVYGGCCFILNVMRTAEAARRVAAGVLSDARAGRLDSDCVEVWEVCADA